MTLPLIGKAHVTIITFTGRNSVLATKTAVTVPGDIGIFCDINIIIIGVIANYSIAINNKRQSLIGKCVMS